MIPLLLATVFLLIQAAIYFHGRSIAQEAAMVGAEEAAMFGAKAGSTSTAAEFAARGGLTDVVVSQDSTNELVTVRVTARVPALLTRDLPLVSGSAQRPKEA